MIDNASVQRFLASKGVYTATIDNDYADKSKKAARAFVSANVPKYKPEWDDMRVRIAVEQSMMTEVGIDAGPIDGVEGTMTQYGWELWQNRMRRRDPPKSGTTPVFCRQSDALAYYGAPGTNHTTIVPPYALFYGTLPVKRISINQKCADSALRAMNAILANYGAARIHQLGLDRYAGCYNNRVMRGGTKLSMHAFACAIDWYPERNALRADHRTALFARPEYSDFLDAWEAEGWTSLGRAKDFDWMHVQAASL